MAHLRLALIMVASCLGSTALGLAAVVISTFYRKRQARCITVAMGEGASHDASLMQMSSYTPSRPLRSSPVADRSTAAKSGQQLLSSRSLSNFTESPGRSSESTWLKADRRAPEPPHPATRLRDDALRAHQSTHHSSASGPSGLQKKLLPELPRSPLGRVNEDAAKPPDRGRRVRIEIPTSPLTRPKPARVRQSPALDFSPSALSSQLHSSAF